MKSLVFPFYKYCFNYVCDEEESTYEFEYFDSIASYSTAAVLLNLIYFPIFLTQNFVCFAMEISIPIEVGFVQGFSLPIGILLLGKFWIRGLFIEYESNYVEKLVIRNYSRFRKELFTIQLIIFSALCVLFGVIPINQREFYFEFVNLFYKK